MSESSGCLVAWTMPGTAHVSLPLLVAVGVKRFLIVILVCVFLAMNEVGYIFHVLTELLYTLFGEMSIQILCPCLNWVVLLLSCDCSLYVPGIMSFA